MVITPKQIRIFGTFLKNPYRELTYREIKELSQEKSNSQIQVAIFRFVEDSIVKKRTIGNMNLYSADMTNPKTLAYFTIITKEQLPKKVWNCLDVILKELEDNPFKSLIVFGSYAEGKQKKESDLDVAILTFSEKEKRNCELAIKSSERKCLISIDPHVFTDKEFLEMLKDKYENLGKQIARKHLAVHNPAVFYSIVQQGIKNGFKIIPPES